MRLASMRRALLIVLSSWCCASAAAARDEAHAAGPIDRSTVLAFLRDACDRQSGDACRTWAGMLEGAASPGGTAIDLYLSAQRIGDEKARQRLDLLRQRGVSIPFSSSGVDATSSSGEIVPIGRMDDVMAPGYHCHYLRAGQMLCHSGID